MPYFIDHADQLELKLSTAPNSGFRNGQLGALHAALAHFSARTDPAILSLPTGYGKTALILALSFALRPRRILVVEPSAQLRRQTGRAFTTLDVLKRISALPSDFPCPSVKILDERPENEGAWAEIAEADVIISTPHCASPAIIPPPAADYFDLIIYDEAHHVPAGTWTAFITHFASATKHVLVTATPFRLDQRSLPGKLAYFYPVSRAAEEQSFSKVIFHAVTADRPLDETVTALSLARQAEVVFDRDRAAGLQHRLLIRTHSIKSAHELEAVYRSNTQLRVEAIASHLGQRKQRDIEQKLINGDLDGVICVDMFGEGYDFPQLKIAVLHTPQKSLVPTLQFIGRFARTNATNIGAATFLAIPEMLREETKRLFREGLDITQFVDEAASGEQLVNEYRTEVMQSFEVKKELLIDYDAVNPNSFFLYSHVCIYRCDTPPDFEKEIDKVAHLQVVKSWMSDDYNAFLILTADYRPPEWAKTYGLENIRHDIFLLVYKPLSRLCFVGATRRTNRYYNHLIAEFCGEQASLLSYEETRRILAGLESPVMFNVGLRNAAITSSAESYRTLTGPQADRAIREGDARAFIQGHFYGRGSRDGETETVGASSRSRVWSNRRAPIPDFLQWVDLVDARISGTAGFAPTGLDIVPHASRITELPVGVIAGMWEKNAFKLDPKVRIRRAGQLLQTKLLTDLELCNFAVSTDRAQMAFVVTDGTIHVPYTFNPRVTPPFRAQPSEIVLETPGDADDWVSLDIWMNEHPPMFFDEHLGSFAGVNANPAPKTTMGGISEQYIESLDWTGCDIRTEFSGAATGMISVHDFLTNRLVARTDAEFVLYDHRTGELADFIVAAAGPNQTLTIELYHCKGAGGAPSGGRVGDVYEVAGQSIKCARACDKSSLLKHIEHRTDRRYQTSPSRFLKGDLDAARQRVDATPPYRLRFKVFAVQPGLSRGQLEGHISDLMAGAIDYLRSASMEPIWMISA